MGYFLAAIAISYVVWRIGRSVKESQQQPTPVPARKNSDWGIDAEPLRIARDVFPMRMMKYCGQLEMLEKRAVVRGNANLAYSCYALQAYHVAMAEGHLPIYHYPYCNDPDWEKFARQFNSVCPEIPTVGTQLQMTREWSREFLRSILEERITRLQKLKLDSSGRGEIVLTKMYDTSMEHCERLLRGEQPTAQFLGIPFDPQLAAQELTRSWQSIHGDSIPGS